MATDRKGKIGENCLRCIDTFPNHFDGRLCTGCAIELAITYASEHDIREFCGQEQAIGHVFVVPISDSIV